MSAALDVDARSPKPRRKTHHTWENLGICPSRPHKRLQDPRTEVTRYRYEVEPVLIVRAGLHTLAPGCWRIVTGLRAAYEGALAYTELLFTRRETLRNVWVYITEVCETCGDSGVELDRGPRVRCSACGDQDPLLRAFEENRHHWRPGILLAPDHLHVTRQSIGCRYCDAPMIGLRGPLHHRRGCWIAESRTGPVESVDLTGVRHPDLFRLLGDPPK